MIYTKYILLVLVAFSFCLPSYSQLKYYSSPLGIPLSLSGNFGELRPNHFHTGLDFCGRVGTEIRSPADGIVVFAGPLTVRGNATIIDHGWGVYTGYMHQSEILVKPGDKVKAGQIIGKVGGTGRVTGPHLHWEVFVGGVQVDPQEWLQSIFP